MTFSLWTTFKSQSKHPPTLNEMIYNHIKSLHFILFSLPSPITSHKLSLGEGICFTSSHDVEIRLESILSVQSRGPLSVCLHCTSKSFFFLVDKCIMHLSSKLMYAFLFQWRVINMIQDISSNHMILTHMLFHKFVQTIWVEDLFLRKSFCDMLFFWKNWTFLKFDNN